MKRSLQKRSCTCHSAKGFPVDTQYSGHLRIPRSHLKLAQLLHEQVVVAIVEGCPLEVVVAMVENLGQNSVAVEDLAISVEDLVSFVFVEDLVVVAIAVENLAVLVAIAVVENLEVILVAIVVVEDLGVIHVAMRDLVPVQGAAMRVLEVFVVAIVEEEEVPVVDFVDMNRVGFGFVVHLSLFGATAS